MASNGNPQFLRHIFSHQPNGAAGITPALQGRQDKVRTSSVQAAAPQPVLKTKPTRTDGSRTKTPRSKNTPIHKNQRVLVGVWIKPRVREELQRIAQTEGISLSSVGSALLEEALQHSLSARYAWLLVRVAFDTGQTRSLVTNILGRQSGMTEDMLKTLAMSQRTAKGNITRKTPQLTELMEAVEQWLSEPPARTNHQ
jgi:hypothetical protein